MKSKIKLIQPELIETRIITVREQKLLLDADLAAIYGVTTKALNQAVKRNADRFPDDFVFQLTSAEKIEVVTICDHLARLKFSPVLPFAFTEHGSIMAANVLNSPRAVQMSVFVVRAFLSLRRMLANHDALSRKLAELERLLEKSVCRLAERIQRRRQKNRTRHSVRAVSVSDVTRLRSGQPLAWPIL